MLSTFPLAALFLELKLGFTGKSFFPLTHNPLVVMPTTVNPLAQAPRASNLGCHPFTLFLQAASGGGFGCHMPQKGCAHKVGGGEGSGGVYTLGEGLTHNARKTHGIGHNGGGGVVT